MKPAIAASLLLALCACGQKVPINTAPPIVWTEPVAEPAVPAGASDREVAAYLIDLNDALKAANNKLRRLREWAESMKD